MAMIDHYSSSPVLIGEKDLRRQIDLSVSRALVDDEFARLLLTDPPNAARRVVRFRAARDPAIDPHAAGDPRSVGATLEIAGAGPGDGATGTVSLDPAPERAFPGRPLPGDAQCPVQCDRLDSDRAVPVHRGLGDLLTDGPALLGDLLLVLAIFPHAIVKKNSS